jgi:hypothetical protein
MSTRFFYDTEFLEDGKTIELISIGIVQDTGRTYYAVNSDMPVDQILKNDWLVDNVWPNLPLRGYKSGLVYVGDGQHAIKTTSPGCLDLTDTRVKPRWVIRNEVREFLAVGDEGDVNELWADYSAYDHVVLSQLFGTMIQLPEWVPMFTRDFQQRLSDVGNPEVPEQESGLHNALDDALHLKVMFDHVSKVAGSSLTTVDMDDLDTLPIGTVVRGQWMIWEKSDQGHWRTPGDSDRYDVAYMLHMDHMPEWTVLHVGDGE